MLTDGEDNWFLRKDHVADLVLKYSPDLVGMQEVLNVQVRHLEKRLVGYKWFGPARDDGKARGERCPIFYRADKFELLEQGTFWLSETSEVPGSTSWGAACRRIVTWGRFKDLARGDDGGL